MDSQEIQLLAQEIGLWGMGQTHDLVEAMPCCCDISYIDDRGDLQWKGLGQTCNRCLKLKELKKSLGKK